jgi:hypothetical protein
MTQEIVRMHRESAIPTTSRLTGALSGAAGRGACCWLPPLHVYRRPHHHRQNNADHFLAADVVEYVSDRTVRGVARLGGTR